MGGSKRVAVITGSNKGIGYAIVRGLCKQFDGDVYLTGLDAYLDMTKIYMAGVVDEAEDAYSSGTPARNEGRGLKAVDDLKKEGCDAKFHQLDITKPDTIDRLKTFLQENYGGLDIRVNNAGISYLPESNVPFGEQAEFTVRTNFTGTLDVCEILFPILRSSARVVNVSSILSHTALNECKPDLQKKLVDIKLISIDDIKTLMKQFLDSAKTGTYEDLGWVEGYFGAYSISKIPVTIMSFIQQREFLRDARSDIIVNACCPGYVDTDFTDHKGTKTIDEGADTPLYLALLPPNTTSPKGELVCDRMIHKWEITQQ